jgi:hypothetical protein
VIGAPCAPSNHLDCLLFNFYQITGGSKNSVELEHESINVDHLAPSNHSDCLHFNVYQITGGSKNSVELEHESINIDHLAEMSLVL